MSQPTKATKTIKDFFKRKSDDSSTSNPNLVPTSDIPIHNEQPNIVSNPDMSIQNDQRPSKSLRIEYEETDVNSLVRDPGLRRQISEYPLDQRDKIRRAYIKAGSFQFVMDYPWSKDKTHRRRFQSSWFTKFPWLEYSPSKDAAFCLPCFLFESKVTGRLGENAFSVEGFSSWKKVNNGRRCAFLIHVGDPCSPHNNAQRSCDDLMNQSNHIVKVMNRQISEEVSNNRLRLDASIYSVRWLALQGCAFRGHNECADSDNRGNFIEFVKAMGVVNDEMDKVILENAPKNVKYTSPKIQKQILHILGNKVRNTIREEVGDSKFCILVDEARDEAKKEKMALVLRFVDNDGFVRECFFDIVSVADTCALTLKKELCTIFSRYSLDICNLRGQGYDGASNMRGCFNGLQALFLKDCPYAYYIHCFAHRLQLALVAAAKNVPHIHGFYLKLTFICNTVGASSKRNTELQSAQLDEIERMVDIGELETGKGANQIGALQRPGDTRWSSHYSSVSSLIKLFDPSCVVLESIQKDTGAKPNIRGDALVSYQSLTSFEFVFTLHLMKEVMGITEILCQALQKKSQDIINAMHLVSSAKEIIQKMRDDGWEALLNNVKLYCERHDITVPDLNASYVVGRPRHQQSHVTLEHHYRFDMFVVALDSQLTALNDRFNEKTMELLILCSALEPKDAYKSFNVVDICSLAEKFYPQDFTEKEREILVLQLQHFEVDIPRHPLFKNMSTISELCRGLKETKKSEVYYLIDRLIRLVLTLPVSTATTERAFSAMKIVKTRLRNKMDDEFLADSLAVFIERRIALSFSNDSIIDDFYAMQDRRGQL